MSAMMEVVAIGGQRRTISGGYCRRCGELTYGDVLAGAEDDVGEAAHEGRVESVLGLKSCHHSIGDGLWNGGESYCESCNQIRGEVLMPVLGKP